MGTAVVTGAARGLGLEISRVFAGRGLTVHLTDIDEAAAISAAAEIGRDAWASSLDVRDPVACAEVAAETVERMERCGPPTVATPST